MRRHLVPPLLAAPLLLIACGKADRQADQLDNAARQADPAAAAVMRNEADRIREKGVNGNAEAAVQSAMANAGAAATDSSEAPMPSAAPVPTGEPGAAPHRAGGAMPPPQAR